MAVLKPRHKFFDNCPTKKQGICPHLLNLGRLMTILSNRVWEIWRYIWVPRVSHGLPWLTLGRLILRTSSQHIKSLTTVKPSYCKQATCWCEQSPIWAQPSPGTRHMWTNKLPDDSSPYCPNLPSWRTRPLGERPSHPAMPSLNSLPAE